MFLVFFLPAQKIKKKKKHRKIIITKTTKKHTKKKERKKKASKGCAPSLSPLSSPLLKQTTNFNVSCHLRAILQKSFENSMILPAALSGRFFFLMNWCGERCSLSLCFSRGPWLVGVVFGSVLLSWMGVVFGPLLDIWNLLLCLLLIGTVTIWQPSELSAEERNLLSSANQSFSVSVDNCCMNVHVPTSFFRRETRSVVFGDEKRQSVFL